jgi:flagellar hook-associated protein 2
MVTSVGSSILTALGASSIDTASLVDQLATAAIATKTKTLTARETANTAKISDLGKAVSSITTFSSSLSSLISGWSAG